MIVDNQKVHGQSPQESTRIRVTLKAYHESTKSKPPKPKLSQRANGGRPRFQILSLHGSYPET
jgi:hypothetical protein